MKNFKEPRLIKKTIAIIAIFLLLMQYMVTINTATYNQGIFTSSECPYDIEFTQIDAGQNGAIGIDKSGYLWYWGLPSDVNLGATADYQLTPRKISNKTFKKVSYHLDSSEKGTAAAIDSNGYLYTWGKNKSGQCGNGTSTDVTTMQQIAVGQTFADIVLTSGRLVALDTTGHLWECGSYGGNYKGNTLTPIITDTKFKFIGEYCAIDESGNLWRWPFDPYYNEISKVTTGISLEKAAITSYFGIYGIDSAGNLYKGSIYPNYPGFGADEPLAIFKDGVKFKDIFRSDGTQNTFYAIDTSGYLWGWGNNQKGELLTNDTVNRTEAIKIFDKPIKQGSADWGNIFFVDTDGISWGADPYVVGNGTNKNNAIPVTLVQLTDKYYTVRFYQDNGTSLIQSKRVQKNKSALEGVSNPTKASTAQYTYTFTGWKTLSGATAYLSNITQDTDVKASYRENLRSYTATFKNYNGTTLQQNTVSYGNTTTYTNAEPTKPGYVFTGWDKDPASTTITENTTFTAQYNDTPIQYTIEYQNIDGATIIGTNPTTYNVETNTFTLNNPTKDGYTFAGWKITGQDDSTATTTITITKGSTGNKSYTAVWIEKTTTPYTVKHYKQKTDGTYTDGSNGTQDLPDETVTGTGTTGQTASAVAENYPGYVVDINKSTQTGTIAGDGSLVLKIYYTPNSNTGYKVEHYLQNLNDTNYTIDNSATENKSGTTGAQTKATSKTYDGYTAQNFNQEEIAGDGSTIVKIYYTRNTNTGYKVEHYLQNLNDTNYTIDNSATENKAGTTGAQTQATSKTYDGYTAQNFNQQEIAGDGSTVIKIYYTRNTNTGYKVEHYLQNLNDTNYTIDNSATENKSGTTGAQTQATSKTYDGYTAQNFNQQEIAGDGSTVIKIYYTRNTNTGYKVEHYLQNLNDTNYTIDNSATENKSGTTGAQTKATSKTYDGYTAQNFNQEEIAGDGSTIVKIYYTRNTNTAYKEEYYFEQSDGTFVRDDSKTLNKTGTTGAQVTAEEKTFDGYTEDTQNTNRVITGTIQGNGSLVLKRYYKITEVPAENAQYKVEHYLQKLDQTGYDIDEEETKTGITGEQTQATAKEYPGYTAQTITQKTILANGSTVVKIYYTRNTNTRYKVEYYLEQEDGSYKKEETLTDTFSGITGESVEAKGKTIDGYIEDIANVDRIARGTIEGDGSTVLKLYYDMKEHVKIVPAEDSKGEPTVEIIKKGKKEIVKVEVDGKEIQKDPTTGKYIFKPTHNGTYTIVVTYNDGTTETYTYEETRFKNVEENNEKDTSGNNTQKKLPTTDTSTATKIMPKAGAISIVGVMLIAGIGTAIMVIIQKRRQ